MTAGAQKYAFQPIGDGMPLSSMAAQRQRAALTQADLDAARLEGHQAGLREAAGQTDRATAEALRAIARMMQMMLSGLGQEAQNLRIDAVDVALKAARLAAGAALDKFGAEAIVAFASEAALHLRDTPRLVVKVAPDLCEAVDAQMALVASDAGLTGQVVVRADATARPGDCTLEWAEGSIHHDRDASFAAIDEAAARWLASAEAQGLQLDLFSP